MCYKEELHTEGVLSAIITGKTVHLICLHDLYLYKAFFSIHDSVEPPKGERGGM